MCVGVKISEVMDRKKQTSKDKKLKRKEVSNFHHIIYTHRLENYLQLDTAELVALMVGFKRNCIFLGPELYPHPRVFTLMAACCC